MEITRNGEVTEITYIDSGQIAEIEKHGNKFHECYMLEAIAEMDIPNGVFVDIGAHVGNHTIFFAKYCERCEAVLAYEPSHLAFDTLKKNIHGIGNVVAYREAIGSTPGKCSIVVNDARPGQNSVRPNNKGKTQIATLPTTVNRVSLIKIDVEGQEQDVLLGCIDVIERDRPELFVETFGDPKDLLELLPEGYKLVKRYNNAPTYHFTANG